MPSLKKFNLIAVLVAATALLALPAAAQATLSFVRGPLSPSVFVAGDNGKGAKKVDSGRSPRLTPDGLSVVYLHEGPGHAQEMKIAPLAGGPTRTLLAGWQEASELAISPDSTTVAALRGGELGKRKLVLIDVASGAQRVLSSGYFSGFSFSPDGTELVFAKSSGSSEKFPPRSDVFRVASAGGKAVAITTDHNAADPLWGPTGKIVFVKYLDANKRKYGPKTELYLMNPQGKQVKRLTHTNVDPLLVGLFPTEWSADGKRLLAEFEGQDTSYAVTVNPTSGAQKAINKTGDGGFVGTALSADGKTVLGFSGGFEPGPNHDVGTVPATGGKLKVLVKNGFEPDWSL
jgi:Tol biopolymer transport system component